MWKSIGLGMTKPCHYVTMRAGAAQDVRSGSWGSWTWGNGSWFGQGRVYSCGSILLGSYHHSKVQVTLSTHHHAGLWGCGQSHDQMQEKSRATVAEAGRRDQRLREQAFQRGLFAAWAQQPQDVTVPSGRVGTVPFAKATRNARRGALASSKAQESWRWWWEMAFRNEALTPMR
jgi:hypothetical protein